MTKDYKQMWNNLDISLEAHNGLLAVLSDAYQNIYLSQHNRPEGMKYFDFVISEVHGLRIEEILEAKKEGRKVIGTFCVYVPEELILAIDGICIGLCAGADIGSGEAEKFVPRNTCALIKAFMGFKLAGLCPYIQTTDIIVGETTCNGKKKAYEIFDEITGGKMYVMEIPNRKGEDGRKLWKNEVKRFAETLEVLAGKKITIEKLQKASKIVNGRRKVLQRLSFLRSFDPSPISGLDALLINQVSFYDDPVRFTEKVSEICDELDERVRKGIGVSEKGSPRILVSGSPVAIPNWKIHAIIEGSGATMVGEESCVGERNFGAVFDDGFSSVEEGIEKIAARYLDIHCACFTPNDERLGDIINLAKRLKADGIIHYAIQFCTPYMMEAFKAKKALDKLGIPFLRIETDYSMEDMGQLKTRIEAFIEMIVRGART